MKEGGQRRERSKAKMGMAKSDLWQETLEALEPEWQHSFAHFWGKGSTFCILKSVSRLPWAILGNYAQVLSRCGPVWFFVTLLTVAHKAPLSMGFSRQGYWSGLLCPPPEDLPNPGIKPKSLTSPALADRFFTTEPPENPQVSVGKGNSLEKSVSMSQQYSHKWGSPAWQTSSEQDINRGYCSYWHLSTDIDSNLQSLARKQQAL